MFDREIHLSFWKREIWGSAIAPFPFFECEIGWDEERKRFDLNTRAHSTTAQPVRRLWCGCFNHLSSSKEFYLRDVWRTGGHQNANFIFFFFPAEDMPCPSLGQVQATAAPNYLTSGLQASTENKAKVGGHSVSIFILIRNFENGCIATPIDTSTCTRLVTGYAIRGFWIATCSGLQVHRSREAAVGRGRNGDGAGRWSQDQLPVSATSRELGLWMDMRNWFHSFNI